jgi:hypothetical protein
MKCSNIWINDKLCGFAEDEVTREEIGSDWSDEVVKIKVSKRLELTTILEDDQRDQLQLIFQLDPQSMRNRSVRGMLRMGHVVYFPYEKEIVDGIPFVPRWSR